MYIINYNILQIIVFNTTIYDFLKAYIIMDIIHFFLTFSQINIYI